MRPKTSSVVDKFAKPAQSVAAGYIILLNWAVHETWVLKELFLQLQRFGKVRLNSRWVVEIAAVVSLLELK